MKVIVAAKISIIFLTAKSVCPEGEARLARNVVGKDKMQVAKFVFQPAFAINPSRILPKCKSQNKKCKPQNQGGTL